MTPRNILAAIGMFGGLGMIYLGVALARCPPRYSGLSGPEYPCSLYLTNPGGQMFYAGIAVLILGMAIYKQTYRKWKAVEKGPDDLFPKKPTDRTSDYKLCPQCNTNARFENGLCLNCGGRDD